MFSSAKVDCLNILILFGIITSVLGDCKIGLPRNSADRPTYYKKVGSHKLKIITGENILRLHDEQEIEAECDNNFEVPGAYQTSNKIYIRCKGSYIYTSTDVYHQNNNDYYNSPNLECSRLTWSLHESSSNFGWCPSNVTSYILARPYVRDSTLSFKYLAGICYDIYHSSFYSVYYTLAPNEFKNEEMPVLEDLYQHTVLIKYIKETFGSNSITEILYKNPQFENWITSLKYEFSSMIQHKKLYNIFNDQFASLLEFVWWPNFRLYNWNYYINALEEHVETNNLTYDILAGVSGAVRVPTKNLCENRYNMEEVVFNTNRKIPLYVWNYLQDRENSTNEMIVIGFNSPFYEVYSLNEIIFCPDMCHEVPWLKNVSSSFHYNIMGVVFCCNVEDVRSSKRLYGFPENDIKPKPVEITELPSTVSNEPTEINDETTEIIDEVYNDE